MHYKFSERFGSNFLAAERRKAPLRLGGAFALESTCVALQISVGYDQRGSIRLESQSSVYDLRSAKGTFDEYVLSQHAQYAAGHLVSGREIGQSVGVGERAVVGICDALLEADKSFYERRLEVLKLNEKSQSTPRNQEVTAGGGAGGINFEAWEKFLSPYLASENPEIERAAAEVLSAMVSSRRQRGSVRPLASHMKMVLDLIWDQEFVSWLQARLAKSQSDSNCSLAAGGRAALKVNLLAYFAATLGWSLRHDQGYGKADTTLKILREVVDVHGPGSCLNALQSAANELRTLSPLQKQLDNLPALSAYQKLLQAAPSVTSTDLTGLQNDIASAVGIQKPTADFVNASASACDSNSTDAPTSLHDTQNPRSPSYDAAAKSLRGLKQYKQLLLYFKFAKAVSLKEAQRLQEFISLWKDLFSTADIALGTTTDIATCATFAPLQRIDLHQNFD